MFEGVKNDPISVRAGELVGGIGGEPVLPSSFTVGDFVDVAPRTWIGDQLMLEIYIRRTCSRLTSPLITNLRNQSTRRSRQDYLCKRW